VRSNATEAHPLFARGAARPLPSPPAHREHDAVAAQAPPAGRDQRHVAELAGVEEARGAGLQLAALNQPRGLSGRDGRVSGAGHGRALGAALGAPAAAARRWPRPRV
jgi:hypothetical protein